MLSFIPCKIEPVVLSRPCKQTESKPSPSTVLPAPVVAGNDDDDDDDDGGDISNPMVKSHVDLVKTVCKWPCVLSLLTIYLFEFTEQ